MFNYIAVTITMVALTAGNAFQLSSLSRLPSRSSLNMVVVDPDVPGQVAPTGFFDPLGLSSGVSENTFKRWRESELKHGRVAMIAALAILVSESFHPLFDGANEGPAIYHFTQMEKFLPGFWLIPTLLTAVFEAASIAKGWAPFSETKGTMSWLKDDYIPGDLGFDPLGLTPKDPAGFREMRTKELQNGRLAMIAAAGFVAQELIDGKTILSHIGM